MNVHFAFSYPAFALFNVWCSAIYRLNIAVSFYAPDVLVFL